MKNYVASIVRADTFWEIIFVKMNATQRNVNMIKETAYKNNITQYIYKVNIMYFL